jgi:hypothetical protein
VSEQQNQDEWCEPHVLPFSDGAVLNPVTDKTRNCRMKFNAGISGAGNGSTVGAEKVAEQAASFGIHPAFRILEEVS